MMHNPLSIPKFTPSKSRDKNTQCKEILQQTIKNMNNTAPWFDLLISFPSQLPREVLKTNLKYEALLIWQSPQSIQVGGKSS